MKKWNYLLIVLLVISQPFIGATASIHQVESDEKSIENPVDKEEESVTSESEKEYSEKQYEQEKTEIDEDYQKINEDSHNEIMLLTSSQNRLALSTESKEIPAGRSAIFNMYLNITNPINMKTSTVKINIPAGYDLGNTLDELTIANVTPVYIDNTLTYNFDNLKEGISINKKIYVRTKNGLTADNTKINLKGTYQMGDSVVQTESGEVTINSTASFSVTNKFTKLVGDTVLSNPSPNDYIVWGFHATLPISLEGSQFIKEGTKITYSVLIDEGLTYQSMVNDNVPEPTITESTRIISSVGEPEKEVKCKKLTWEITAPSYEKQANEYNSLDEQDLSMILHVEKEVKVFTTIQVNAEAGATFVGGYFQTSKNLATIMIGPNDNFSPETSMGTAYTPAHYGAFDGNGTVSSSSQNDDPNVYAGDTLTWRFKYSGGLDIQQIINDKYRFKRYEFEYDIDSKLDFTGITMQRNYFMPNTGTPIWTPIQEEPKFDVYVKYCGELGYQEEPVLKSIGTNKSYSAIELGLNMSKKVASIKLHTSDAPVGLYGSALIHTKARSGEIGKIINHARQRIQGFVFSQGSIKDYTYSEEGIWDNDNKEWNINSAGWKKFMTAKTANLIERPKGKDKIVSTSVELQNSEKNKIIVSGENNITLTIESDKASISDIEGPFVSYLSLPKGIIIDDSKIDSSLAEISIMNNDFLMLGKQLIRVKWNQGNISPNGNIKIDLPVLVNTEDTTKVLGFDHFLTLAYNSDINVPDTSEHANVQKELDIHDINGNGDKDEFVFRSSNLYYSMKNESIVISTEVVNSQLIKATNSIITAIEGENVKVNLNLHKLSSKVLDKIVLVGTIPTINDSTITTAEKRKSEIDSCLVSALEIPSEWIGKVKVYYSETANPNSVGVLDKYTNYQGLDPILNPLKGEEARWMLEEEVNNFENMKSFKIVSNEVDDNWIEGSAKTIGVNLVIPTPSIKSLDVKNAFITAAVAINDIIPTESTKAGFKVLPNKSQLIEQGNPVELEKNEELINSIEPIMSNINSNSHQKLLSEAKEAPMKNNFPQTGEQNLAWLSGIGVVLISMVKFTLYKKRQ